MTSSKHTPGELNPCPGPECEHDAPRRVLYLDFQYCGVCEDCGMHGPSASTAPESIRLWNAFPSLSTFKLMLEALEAVLDAYEDVDDMEACQSVQAEEAVRKTVAALKAARGTPEPLTKGETLEKMAAEAEAQGTRVLRGTGIPGPCAESPKCETCGGRKHLPVFSALDRSPAGIRPCPDCSPTPEGDR